MKHMIRKILIVCAAMMLIGQALADDVLSATRRASDMAASAVFPSGMISSDYLETSAAGEPYLIKCTAQANRIILYLHMWSGDYKSVKTDFPELATLDRACIVSPNFNGPNTTPQAMGSDDALARIDIVLREVQYKTGLSRVYIAAASGGTMAALNYMGKYPGRIHLASLWLIIHDLSSLYTTTQDQQLKDNMLSVIGTAPSGPDDPAYLVRSPRARLATTKGPVKVFLNYGTLDVSTPPAQADAAKAQINSVAPDVDVTLKSWPIAHAFAASTRQEAIKQLVLE
ncbi:S9 family peptidase [Pseudomonas sp. FP1742]|uniref:alpha/beta hydrolase family protein n=1 Tax=Pseudomonas sp. FP1742 TaxID=2954079 RepID=UPI002736217F|nr:alpha/beta hydrolase [Pseudomonas sp. FP1742]WLG49097.1 alpha/beta hydrolase [Pseudomonas sp. FP1742]